MGELLKEMGQRMLDRRKQLKLTANCKCKLDTRTVKIS